MYIQIHPNGGVTCQAKTNSYGRVSEFNNKMVEIFIGKHIYHHVTMNEAKLIM